MITLNRSLTMAAATLMSLGSIVACDRDAKVDIETVPVGAEVALTKQDGGVVQGSLSERSTDVVKVKSDVGVRSIPRADIADVQVVDKDVPAPPLPPIARFREYTIPAGTELSARLNTALNSETNRVEDRVEASVTEAVMQGDTVVIPEGSTLRGEVTAVEESGKVKGRANLAVRFHTLTIAEHDEPYPVSLGISRVAPGTKKEDAAKIGIPAAAGGIIGGILGGKKGAVTGVVIGGGAGTAVVLTTAGKEVELPAGSALTMKMGEPVDIRVPLVKK